MKKAKENGSACEGDGKLLHSSVTPSPGPVGPLWAQRESGLADWIEDLEEKYVNKAVAVRLITFLLRKLCSLKTKTGKK